MRTRPIPRKTRGYRTYSGPRTRGSDPSFGGGRAGAAPPASTSRARRRRRRVRRSAPSTSVTSTGFRRSRMRAARAFRDPAAEEVGRARAEDAAGRDGVALVAPVLRPRDRLGPLRLQVGPGRAVEERLLELPPAALEVDPRECLAGRLRVARNRHHGRAQLTVRAARVVAADAGLGRAAEVERLGELVRVRAGARVDDRVRPVDELELVVVPSRRSPRLRASCSRPRPAPRRAPPRASSASKRSWIISQSPSCVLLKSLKA